MENYEIYDFSSNSISAMKQRKMEREGLAASFRKMRDVDYTVTGKHALWRPRACSSVLKIYGGLEHVLQS
jgi:hypothetical protein